MLPQVPHAPALWTMQAGTRKNSHSMGQSSFSRTHESLLIFDKVLSIPNLTTFSSQVLARARKRPHSSGAFCWTSNSLPLVDVNKKSKRIKRFSGPLMRSARRTSLKLLALQLLGEDRKLFIQSWTALLVILLQELPSEGRPQMHKEKLRSPSTTSEFKL